MQGPSTGVEDSNFQFKRILKIVILLSLLYLLFVSISIPTLTIILVIIACITLLLRMKLAEIRQKGPDNFSPKLKQLLFQKSIFDIYSDILYFPTISRIIGAFVKPILSKPHPQELKNSFQNIHPKAQQIISTKGLTVNSMVLQYKFRINGHFMLLYFIKFLKSTFFFQIFHSFPHSDISLLPKGRLFYFILIILTHFFFFTKLLKPFFYIFQHNTKIITKGLINIFPQKVRAICQKQGEPLPPVMKQWTWYNAQKYKVLEQVHEDTLKKRILDRVDERVNWSTLSLLTLFVGVGIRTMNPKRAKKMLIQNGCFAGVLIVILIGLIKISRRNKHKHHSSHLSIEAKIVEQ